MAIVIKCRECGRVYHVPADDDLTEITCSCGQAVPVPSTATPAEPESAAIPHAPAPPEDASTDVSPSPAVGEAPVAAPSRRLQLAIGAAVLAGGVLAWLVSMAGDLNIALWSVRLPGVPGWGWFVAPAAGLALLWLLAPKQRPGGLAAVAGVVGCVLLSAGLLVVLHRMTFPWRPIVRDVFGGLTWAAVWPVLGAGGAAVTVVLSAWFERILPEAPAGGAAPAGARISAAVIGACTGIAAALAARVLPGLTMPGSENWTEPAALAGMALLAAIIGGAIALAALDFGLQHEAGRLPLTGALCGVIAGAIVEPLLGLRGVPMLIALAAVPVAGGLGGMAAGLAVNAGGRAKRVALAALMLAALGIVIAGTVYYPSPEAIRARMLISQAAEPTEEGHEAVKKLREVDDPSAIRALAAGMHNDEDDVAFACAWALSEIDHPKARSALLKVIDHENSRLRQAAIRGMIRGDDHRAIKPLRRMLTGDDGPMARRGAWGLSGLGEPGLSALLEVARSGEPEHRSRALSGLGRLVESEPRAREAILAALEDESASVRADAVGYLDDLDPDQAFERVSAMLSDPDSKVQAAAVRALARMEDPRAVDVLAEALRGGDESVMRSAAEGLGKIGTPEAVAALKEAVESGDQNAVRYAANGLGHAGTTEAVTILRDLFVEEALSENYGLASNALLNKDDLDISPLIPLIAHEDERVRHRAYQFLPGMVHGYEQLIEGYLDHERAQTRAIAVHILTAREMKPDVAKIVPLLTDPEEGVQTTTVMCLSRLGKSTVPALADALGDDNTELASRAAEVLGYLEDGSNSAVQPLVGALDDARPEVAAAAAGALGEIGDTSAIGALTEAFGSADQTVRSAAALALAKLGAAEMTDELVAMLETGAPATRTNAAEALGVLKDESAVEPLVDALSDSSHEVRFAASRALSEIGEPAIEPLIPLVDSGDRWVREGARSALGSIDHPEAKKALEGLEPEVPEAWMVPPPAGP